MQYIVTCSHLSSAQGGAGVETQQVHMGAAKALLESRDDPHFIKRHVIHDCPNSNILYPCPRNSDSLILTYRVRFPQTRNKRDKTRSDRDKLLLRVGSGTGPGLKLEIIAVVKVKTLICIVSLGAVLFTHCLRFGKDQRLRGKPKSVGRGQHSRSRFSFEYRWLGSSRRQDRSWFPHIGSNRYP
jgi:hypothetical protein